MRVGRKGVEPSPAPFIPSTIGVAGGFSGNTVNAAYYNGKTYVGFCDNDGNARVCMYNHSTQKWSVSPAIVAGIGNDIHCTPSVVVRSSDHKIVIAVATHGTVPAIHMYVAISTNAEDISAWGTATDIQSSLGATMYTYANLFQLSGESGKLYLFYRDTQDTGTSGVLCYSTSTDGGATWAAQTVLYKNTGKQCYWAIGSDGTSRIDFLVSDGTANNADAASVYHFYYSGGSRFKSDGTLISASLPLTPSNITKVLDSTSGSSRIPYVIVTNGGNPVAVWATYDPAGSGANELYWYGSCSSGTWTVNQITDSGSHPDPNFSEGGLSIDQTTVARVFISKKTSSVWQMFKYETANSGMSWTNTQLTSDSSTSPTDVYNMRSTSPRDAVSTLTAIWCFGPHWATATQEPSGSQLRAYPNPVQPF